jgi:rubrerythrin
MNDIDFFLAHAVRVEREAARRYEELAQAMQSAGNRELQAFFTRMAHFSRLHLADAQARAGFHDLPPLKAEEYEWPEGIAPETADWAGVDALMDVPAALQLALEGERRGHAYYLAIASTTTDAELRSLAGTFAAEEDEHVAELERMLASSTA